MTAFKPRGRRILSTKLPQQDGSWVKRSTGTKDRVTARAIDRAIEQLGPAGKHAWDLLEAMTSRPPRWSLSEFWRRWCAVPGRVDDATGQPIEPSLDERIKALRAQLAEVDLSPLVDEFYDVMAGPSSGVAVDTAQHYRASIRLLIPKDTPFYRSQLSPKALTQWLERMTGVSPSTVRKRGDGMRRFISWCRANGHLDFDPMRDVVLPPASAPRLMFLETADALRLADAQPGPYRTFSALLAGTGIDVSTALGLKRRDVDVAHAEIRAPGTKTYNRDRVVKVATWAWEYVRELTKGRHPDARLFEDIPHRWEARDQHIAACDALVEQGHTIYDGYWQRDARHTWAVRAARSGWPMEAIARQLGHVNAVLVAKVYGRFAPTQVERDRWEQLADARDQEQAKNE